MPITSVYDIGTVSVGSEGITVTGVGTNWIGAGIREGDLFWVRGLLVRVLALVDNTTLTLAHPWPGPAVVSGSYEIHYVPDAQRILAKSLELLNSLEGGAVGPLKGVAPEADTLPYFNSGSTAAKAALTTLGRLIIASEDTGEAQTALGLIPQSGLSSPVANRLLRVGSFGLGSEIPPVATNLNATDLRTGFYSVVTATASGDLPTLQGTRDVLLNISFSASFAVQIYFSSHANTPIYQRSGTPWVAWNQFVIE